MLNGIFAGQCVGVGLYLVGLQLIVLRQPLQSALWLVGPEGDFTPEEMAVATAAGFVPVTLGPLVLRCVTAATCALGILRHETG